MMKSKRMPLELLSTDIKALQRTRDFIKSCVREVLPELLPGLKLPEEPKPRHLHSVKPSKPKDVTGKTEKENGDSPE